MRNEMLNDMKKLNTLFASTGVVKINNIIEAYTLEEVQEVLKEKFGYKYFIKNKAYRTANDIGDANKCLTIQAKKGYYCTVVATYEKR